MPPAICHSWKDPKCVPIVNFSIDTQTGMNTVGIS